jgi:hypothetical protein
MIARVACVVSLFVGAGAAAAGCSSDSKKGGDAGAPLGNGEFQDFCHLPQSCRDIAQACMPKDDGSKGTIHDCHLTGHETGTDSACSKVHDNCVATCTAAPALSDGPVEDLAAGCHDGGTTTP